MPTYVVAHLHRLARGRMERAMSERGLVLREHQVLACLEEFGEVSQQQVCDAIDADRSDMVRQLDHMERRGLVVRDRDVADRRRHVLTLTAEGRRALVEGEEVIRDVTDQLLAGLTERERRTLHELLLRVLGEPAEVLPGRA
jgi:DNA-binding MarR family transcriptional regulator